MCYDTVLKRFVLALAVLAGCSKKSDYSGEKLVPTAVTADGATYVIDIPEGLPKDDRNPGDWSNAKAEYDYAPRGSPRPMTTASRSRSCPVPILRS